MVDLQFWAFLKLVKLLSRAPFKEAIGRRAGIDMVMVDMLMLWFNYSGNVGESLGVEARQPSVRWS